LFDLLLLFRRQLTVKLHELPRMGNHIVSDAIDEDEQLLRGADLPPGFRTID
jgi:hypothetical protein